ncbi:uncharacterized protein PHACADRAFT_207305 [Phanerochaete carnosa HHB-10118-sp]|uniref:F-box domain-containing protein n=1 Tax=Phanerochaete carnosa (strain HHB-10118-sp) TaxID=650164 RepID=K5X6J8_PHACS|nr:uncharacterized protein PHACADRAFT_207305 [Phanerochaete carnosa HHB-10118-sp]EKM58492.1 hypothetical protein PHACADRAFT_207305 [Phanerochaete carnosa HHB-10118-sp]
MDSDDEDILQYERETLRYSSYSRRYKGEYPVRLYEKEEDQWIYRSITFTVRQGTTYNPRNDPCGARGVQYRVLRFYEMMKGFHTGILDLAGRHECRYRSVKKRWMAFAAELHELLEHSTEMEVPVLDPSGEVIMLPGDPPEPLMSDSFCVDPNNLLKQFEEKWRLTVYSIGAFKCLYEEVNECIEANPEPMFQMLCLMDLPPELLHIIMEACGVDGARRLGAACRPLRMVSLPYIYKDRILKLKFDPKWDEVDGKNPSEFLDYVQSLAMTARDSFIRDAAFLQSRPDITQCIESLSITGWSEAYCNSAGWQPFDENVTKFFLPVALYAQDLIARCPNIKRLSLSFMVITEAARENVIALQKLEHLRIMCSKVVGSATPHHPASAVPNLTIWTSSALDSSAWTFMPSLTNVRWLWLTRSGDAPRILPPPEIIQSWNPLITTERASIDGVQCDEWPDLVTLFTSASLATDHHLPLTHLKISLTYGIPSFIVDELLAALEGSALQYLVLDGTTYGEPEIIDDVAQKLPNLKSLTLVYRDSYRQSKEAPANWPYPTWEYAQRLGRFHHLSHFSWNLDVPVSLSPAAMRLFEDGYPEERWEYLEDEWFYPSGEVAKLLAAYCPTLEMVMCSGLLGSNWAITRSPEGSIQIEELIGSSWQYREQYNPTRFSSWPLLGLSDDS